jgi:hypothetical protein
MGRFFIRLTGGLSEGYVIRRGKAIFVGVLKNVGENRYLDLVSS